jgi:hypothetical protein
VPVTDPSLLPWLTGPYAALVLALIVIWGLWKLYQAERAERRANFEVLQQVIDGFKDLREAERESSPPRGRRR